MGLRTISGLRHGWIKARESKPVTLVSEDRVQVTLPCVAPQAAAMIRLQLLTRMRPGEVLCMTPRDLDRSGDIWIYKPKKTQKTLARSPSAHSTGGPSKLISLTVVQFDGRRSTPS